MKWITFILLLLVHRSQAQDSLNSRYRDSVVRSFCPVCSPAAAAPSGPADVAFHQAHELVRQARFDEAFPYINTAMDDARSKGRIPLLYFSHLLKAVLFHARNLPADALTEYRQAIDIHTNLPLLTEIYVSAGLIHFEKGASDSAYHYFLLATRSLNASSSPLIRKNLYANLSLYYSRAQDWPRAEDYALRSLAIEKELGNVYGIAQSCLGIGTLYYNQYKDAPAIRYYLESLRISRREKYFQVQQYAAMNLASLFSEKGDHRQAFAYLKEADEVKDSVYGRDKFLGLLEQQKKYELARKQSEIAGLEQERTVREAYAKQKELQSRIYLTIGIFLFVLTGVIVLAYRQKTAANRRIEAQKDQLNELNRTKDQLFSIIAHDLRSPVQGLNRQLTSLKQALAARDTAAASLLAGNIEQTSNNTYALLNNLLYWSLGQTGGLSLHPERHRARALVDQACYDYLPIAQAKKITLANDTPDALYLYADLNAVRLILRNIIDNAIKYTPEGGCINIDGSSRSGSCSLVIRDSGVGMNEDVREALTHRGFQRIQSDTEGQRGTGLGLSLVRSMLEESGGSLQIDSSEGAGTSVIISLPLILRNHEQPENISAGR